MSKLKDFIKRIFHKTETKYEESTVDMCRNMQAICSHNCTYCTWNKKGAKK